LSLFDDRATITWGHSALRLTVDVTAGEPVSIRELTDGRAAEVPVRPAQPLVEILTPGTWEALTAVTFAPDWVTPAFQAFVTDWFPPKVQVTFQLRVAVVVKPESPPTGSNAVDLIEAR
jgi:hypothetical protein